MKIFAFLPRGLLCRTYLISPKRMYARIKGPVIKRNGLYENADLKSRRAKDTIIRVIPHPGHSNPVST